MEQVIISAGIKRKLNDLVDILYEKEYFGFKADAVKYVNNIIGFIYRIPKQKHHSTKRLKYGKYYSRFKPNKNTTYYITFDIIEEYYFFNLHKP
jgi:hypothetical protein